MTHEHEIKDSDFSFYINPKDRGIYNQSPGKIALIQGDHDSERFSFRIPRYIEGHDTSVCDKIHVHYNNIAANKIDQSKDVYLVKDMKVDPADENYVIFSWLISGNATMHAGILSFLIEFLCLDGEEITYSWHTGTYSTNVGEGMNNSKAVKEKYSDVLAAWEAEVVENINKAVNKALEDATKIFEGKLGALTKADEDNAKSIEDNAKSIQELAEAANEAIEGLKKADTENNHAISNISSVLEERTSVWYAQSPNGRRTIFSGLSLAAGEQPFSFELPYVPDTSTVYEITKDDESYSFRFVEGDGELTNTLIPDFLLNDDGIIDASYGFVIYVTTITPTFIMGILGSEGTHTFSLYQVGVVKLPEEYLPDNLMKTIEELKQRLDKLEERN